MNLTEFLRDESGRESISRLLPLVTLLAILAIVAYVSCKRGELVTIPDSWITLFGITASTYGVAKGLQLGLGKKEASDGNP